MSNLNTNFKNEFAATLTAEEIKSIMAAREAAKETQVEEPEWVDAERAYAQRWFADADHALSRMREYTAFFGRVADEFYELSAEDRKEKALRDRKAREEREEWERCSRSKIDNLDNDAEITHHREDGSKISYRGWEVKKWARAIGYTPRFSKEAIDLRYEKGMTPGLFLKLCLLDKGTWVLKSEKQSSPAKAVAAAAIGVGALALIRKLTK